MNDTKYMLSKYNVIIHRPVGIFLWNTLTNAMIKLDESGLKYIESFDGKQSVNPFFNVLKDNGCIVATTYNELGRVLHDEKAAMLNPFPKSIHFTIAPGLACNYNCVYCFENRSSTKSAMSREMQSSVCDYIIASAERNLLLEEICITWFGGEPLLYMDAISYMSERMISYCITKGINYGAGIVTNGRLLSQSTAKSLKQYGIRYVQLSFDGMPEQYIKQKRATLEDFNATVNNIVSSSDILPITVRINVADSIDDALELTRYLLIDKGLDGRIKVYLAHIRNYDHLNIDEEKRSQTKFYDMEGKFMSLFGNDGPYSEHSLFYVSPRRRCTTCHSVCDSNACIGPNGEFYRCEHFFGQPEYSVGTIQYGRNFTEQEHKYLMFQHPQKCLNCKFFPVCLGGCMNDNQDGDIALACDAFIERMIDNLLLHYRDMKKPRLA